MEYESRKVKWYWLGLFIAFSVGVVYLLFSGNPYLYSHLELRSALVAGEVKHRRTIPAHPLAPAKLGAPVGFARYNFQRTGLDPIGTPRSREYVEFEKTAVALDNLDVQAVASDQTGFVLTGKTPRAARVDLDGQVRWSFAFLEPIGERGVVTALLDDQSVYLVHPAGEIACLNKQTGEIRWILDVHQDVAAQPFLFGHNVIVPVKGDKGVQLVQLARGDGKIDGAPQRLDVKPGFGVTEAPTLEALLFSADNKITAVDPETWKPLWTQTLTEPARGPVLVVDNQIFITTLGGKLIRLDGAKRRVDWEVDLEKPALSLPAYLPIMHRLSFVDAAGQLVVVDAKQGKVLWRTPLENRAPFSETWSARLKGHNIEEFKMDWSHKGWVVWAPCRERSVCLFTPNKGQPIDRISLSGAPLALPIALEKRWVFFTQTKPGHYAVSKLVEESEAKKLEKR